MNSIGKLSLFRNKPTTRWLEGIPGGNGTMGVMAWGGPDDLILSLDHNDLWYDCSPKIEPMRFSAGELILDCGTGSRFEEGLDLSEAVAYRTTGKRRIEWFMHAEEPVLCVRILNAPGRFSFRWQPPELWSQAEEDKVRYVRRFQGKAASKIANPSAGRAGSSRGVKNGLGFMRFTIDGKARLLVGVRACQGGETISVRQKRDGFEVAAKEGGELLLLVSVWALDRNPAMGIEEAFDQLAARTPARWTNLLASHRKWWRQFWSRSSVSLSNATLDRLWHMGTYHLGCSARPDSLPISIQGMWSPKGTPFWAGRYFWDLNVQSCYWPIYTGNHLELGYSLYNWYLAKLPLFCENVRSLFGAEGATAPPTCDADGVRRNKTRSDFYFGHGAWVCHNFWQHYQYTHDVEFLRTHCLPVFREHLKFARHLWHKGKDGRYHIEHAFSPELTFLATPQNPCRDAVYEISLGRFLAQAYIRTLTLLGEQPDDLSYWAKDFLRHLADYPTARTTGSNYYWPEDPSLPDFFVEWPGLETQMSHRHHSHLMMIYPLGEIHRFSPYRQLRTAQNSMHMLILRGTGGYESFAFPWASLLATRSAWPHRMPVHMLEEFAKCRVVPFNGLTSLDDFLRLGVGCQTGPYGPFHLDNFTTEPSLIAVTAVQDILLHAAGQHLVFAGGASPELDGEFQGLRSPFGDIVAGRIEAGRLVSAELISERKGARHWALDGTAANWKLKTAAGVKQQRGKSVVSVQLEKGEACSLRRA